MKINVLAHFGLILLLLLSSTVTLAQEATGSLWVTVENNAIVPQMIHGKLVSSDALMQQLVEDFTIVSFEKALPSSRREDLQQVYEVACLCNEDALIEAVVKNDVCSKPEKAPRYELMTMPNDYNMACVSDYALDLIGAPQAWNYSTGDPDIVLGISDGSFLVAHEDLQNAYVSVQNSATAPMQYYYHGTAVAITAAGSTNNGQGKSSIGYDCKMALTTIGYDRMLQLAHDGARVINASWSTGCYFNQYHQSVIDEIYDLGAIVVASAGNGGTCGGPEALAYPAAYDHVIAVSSVGPNDNHERVPGDPGTTHQHNSSVDICAPGYDVALTVSPGWYLTGSGTSFAAPYVTGTIGLMLSLRPCLTFEEVLEILQTTAANIDAQNPNYVGMLGAGRLDAAAALAYTSAMSCSPGNSGNNNGHSDPGGDGNNGHGNDPGNDPSNPGGIKGPKERGTNGPDLLGFEETTKLNAHVFPNPTNTNVTMRWDQSVEVTLTVYAADGKHVGTYQVGSDQQYFELELFEAGAYFIRLSSEGALLWTEKVIRL